MRDIPIIQVGNVLLSPDIINEYFCCDLDVCKGACCVEGDAGAPVTFDEVALIEDVLDDVWGGMSATARQTVDRQGVVYADRDGELVTSIVHGRDCVFACHDDDCCLCLFEKAWLSGKTSFRKPVSCALYPIREKRLGADIIGLNYHRWDICECGRVKGRALRLALYKFLKEPLAGRFGEQWYEELENVVAALREE